MGLDIYLSRYSNYVSLALPRSPEQTIEIPSTKYPDHLFKIGYFRSSYNSGGFDHVAGISGWTLARIFDRERNDKYEFQPDWEGALERARNCAVDLRVDPRMKYFIIDAAANPFSEMPELSEKEALDLALAEIKKDPFGDNEGWSSINGGFYPSGLKIVAYVPSIVGLGVPGAYLIGEREDDGWYAQAAEIVAETCEWALANKPEELWLRWSS